MKHLERQRLKDPVPLPKDLHPATKRLLSEFFQTEGFVFRPGLQGQAIGPFGEVMLGDRSGPALNIPSALCHEMAHAVEIDDRRVQQWAWGLKVRQCVINFQSYDQPLTYQSTERELRVCAFQANLQTYLGMPDSDIEYTAMALQYMSDWCMVPEADYIHPLARKKSNSSFDQPRLTWVLDRLMELREKPEYQIEPFITEWNRKAELIASRMQHKTAA